MLKLSYFWLASLRVCSASNLQSADS